MLMMLMVMMRKIILIIIKEKITGKESVDRRKKGKTPRKDPVVLG